MLKIEMMKNKIKSKQVKNVSIVETQSLSIVGIKCILILFYLLVIVAHF